MARNTKVLNMILSKIVNYKHADQIAIVILSAFCIGFALGLPGAVGGVLAILGAAYLTFRWKLRK